MSNLVRGRPRRRVSKEVVMVYAKEMLEAGLEFHGHKCPAMPLGLRSAETAMNKLGVERTGAKDLLAILELGENHCAHCYADGIQMMTGCTFGKGNIRQLGFGKFGLTLVDRKTGRAVRVVPKAEAQLQSQQSEFFQDYRMKGVPPTEVPDQVVQPLIDKVMAAPAEQLFKIGEVEEYHEEKAGESFQNFVCEECGDLVVEEYGRVKQGKRVCMPCAANG